MRETLLNVGDLISAKEGIFVFSNDESADFPWLGQLHKGDLFLIVNITSVSQRVFDDDTNHRRFDIIVCNSAEKKLQNHVSSFIVPGLCPFPLVDLEKYFEKF